MHLEVLNLLIDKMTIVGNLNAELSYALQNIINEPHVWTKGTPTTGYVEGKFFNIDYKESVYFQYDDANSKAMGKRNFRMEFNPSKITHEQSQWLKDKVIYILDDVGITRIDLAFDCDFDLSLFNFEFKNPLGGRNYWGMTGKTETLYFGSRNSDFHYRIYDKKLEQEQEIKKKVRADEKRKLQKLALKEHDSRYSVEPLLYDTEHWWRYEVEIKNADTIDKIISFGFPIFQDKRIIQYDVDSLPVEDNLMVTGLLVKPRLMGHLTRYKRLKFRKIMKNLGGNDITDLFKEKLEQKKPELIGEINSWLKINYSVR